MSELGLRSPVSYSLSLTTGKYCLFNGDIGGGIKGNYPGPAAGEQWYGGTCTEASLPVPRELYFLSVDKYSLKSEFDSVSDFFRKSGESGSSIQACLYHRLVCNAV